ncbi:MAG: T9SS type A sorting domain-containing protein [Roseivirga sp.]|nr:T9SS type A sorting domain-containing protein [Roseivirga sp.]
MEKLYPRVDLVHKRVLRLLLIVLFIPNVSLSQTNIPLTRDLNSFETPIVTHPLGYEYTPSGSAWTFTGQAGLTRNGTAFTWANPNAPAQNQVLFLQNQGYVETTFNFQSSGYYRFLFKAAWREGCCEQPKYIRVLVDGVVVNGVTVNDFEVGEVELRSKNYEQYFTLPVELTSGNHTIRLEGDNPTVWGDYTGFVDDFRIQKLQEMPNYLGWTVPAGTTYAIGSNTYNFSTLKVDGTLVAPQNHDVTINANYILVRNSGRFQIGQELSPYPEKATITLNGTNMSQHGHMGTKFLGAMNDGVIELHGKEKVSWTKLRETVNPGGGTIKLAEAVDWEVGDEIVIAPSRAPGRTPSGGEDDSFANEYEKRTIASITNGNKDLTLNSGVTYRHTGVTKPYSGNGQNWTADIRAEVGLLTRNIKIQGHNSGNKIGAHVMIMRSNDDIINMKKPQAYFNGVELYRMGQNKELGRYPFHWHRMDDVDGQYFKNSSVHQSYNRALTIHATNNTLVENSVFFDHIGHGIFFEEGNEEGNKILGNLVIGSKRPSSGEAMSSHALDGETLNEWQNRGPASYWITHPNNTIEGNVAAGTVGTGFWFIFPRWDTGGQGKETQKAPFGSFKNNVAHSASSGFDIFDELGWTDWSTVPAQFYPHSVHANIGYLSTQVYEILNCTWYANRVGVYTGTDQNRYHPDEYGREIYAPNDHLIFKNNIFADNEKAVMLASDNQIKNSIFVDDTGEGNAPSSGRSLAFVYDGAAKISDSHIVGYNTPNSGSSAISFAGAAFTYGNFRFKNVTNTGSDLVFNGTAALSSSNKRNVTIYDEDGSLTGSTGTFVVDDNLGFNLFGAGDLEETIPSGWTKMEKSTRNYCITRLRVHIGDSPYGVVPKVDVKREKTGTPTVTVPTASDGSTPTLPFIMNDEDLLYTYDWVYGSGQDIGDHMPGKFNTLHRILQFKLANAAESGDFVIVRFKDMGHLTGLSVNMNYEQRVSDIHPSQTGLAVFQEISLLGLKNSNISAYYIDPTTKYLYIKAYSNGQFAQYFNIRWFGLPSVANNTETLEGERVLPDNKQVVYPNPASDKLYIKGLKAGVEVQVVDLSGRLMQTSTYNNYLDISQIKSGMYVVRTQNGNFKFKKQ